MSTCYFWGRGNLRVVRGPVIVDEAIRLRLTGMWCVDTDHQQPALRYGMFRVGLGWEAHPIDDFPKEFRARLLLLGVS